MMATAEQDMYRVWRRVAGGGRRVCLCFCARVCGMCASVCGVCTGVWLAGENGRVTRVAAMQGHSCDMNVLSYSPDGQTIAKGAQGGFVKLCIATSGR